MWSSLGSLVGVLFAGFWAFHTYTVNALRESQSRQLTRETERMNDSIAQFRANNQALLESLRRETDAKAETAKAERQMKLRELELLNQAAVAQLEERGRREKETLNGIVDSLRQKLSVSRSSLEISASGDFVSVNDLLVDEKTALARLAEGNFVNLKHLLLPDYAGVGWQKFEDISMAQLDAYVREKSIKLAPDEETAKQVQWQPLLTMWVKDTKDAVAAVGAAELSQQEFIDFLQRGNVSTTTTRTDKDGLEHSKTETTTIDAKKLSVIPVGISAYTILATTLFADYLTNPQLLTVTSFSARSDALHFSATVNDGSGKRYDFELLVLQDRAGVFVLFNAYNATNALDPISREATDWLRAVRIVKR